MRRAAALLLCALLLAGCGGLPPAPVSDEPPPFEFRLGPGDRVRMDVWGEKQLKLELTLGPDGAVSIPLVGDVALSGFTLDEARVELAKRLKAGYVDPTVSLNLLEMRSHVIHVVGAVEKPGSIAFVRGATALAAVQAAGGPRPGIGDLSSVRLIRHRTSAPKAYEVDLDAVLEGEARDVWLIPGDTIAVPARPLARWNRFWRLLFPWSDPVEDPR
ncbi:MAG: polysaccharide biosynthesis/export family protein [Planctomycetota bacterium]